MVNIYKLRIVKKIEERLYALLIQKNTKCDIVIDTMQCTGKKS